MDNTMKARIKMQGEAKTEIRKANYNAAIIVTVGGGKGKIMLDLAMELIAAGKVKSILYLCDNRRLRDSKKEGFPAEIEKWGDEKLKSMTTLSCYQTACKWIDEEFDLVLGDEIDFAITPRYWLSILNNKFKYKILLSGTLSLDKKLVLTKTVPIVYRFNTVDAEEAEVVNKTKYYIYNYKLSESESRTYESYTKKITALMKAEVGFEDKDLQFWTRKRKHFLNALDSSVTHCKKIKAWIWENGKRHKRKNRTVIFCELTEQADKVCKWSYHGGNEQTDNLAKFQNEEIDSLSVVAKIKRGINLKKANIAIFESFNGSTTEWEQRNGRMKRLKQSEIAIVIFMVPYYQTIDRETSELIWKPTVARDWLTKATKNITNIIFENLKL